MSTWWHNLMHRLGLTSGYIDHEQDANGVWWFGLRCSKCGKITNAIRSRFQDRCHVCGSKPGEPTSAKYLCSRCGNQP